MNFWRSLFDRQNKPFKSTYPVTPIVQPPATGTTTSTNPLGLQTLALSSTLFITGTPSTGTILNATNGSIIVPGTLPSGLTIDSAPRTWAWTGFGAPITSSFLLYENIPGASSNPNISTINYSIRLGTASGQFGFNSPANSAVLILLEDI